MNNKPLIRSIWFLNYFYRHEKNFITFGRYRMNTLHRSMAAVIVIALLLSGAQLCNAGQYVQTSPQRICQNLNAGWLYCSQNIANGQSKSRSESSFEKVCLPHTNKIVTLINIDTSCFAFISWY